MNRILVLTLVSLTTVAGSWAQVTLPNSFTSGTTISASQVNANFTTLLNAINSQASTIAALQAQLAAKGTALPLGSITATFVAPDASLNYMTGSTEWAFADGTLPSDVAATYTGLFPDLRGQFLRGVNANRADGKEDPDFAGRTGGDLNKGGSFQDDAFQGHKHYLESWYGENGNGSSNPHNQGYGAAGPYGNSIDTKDIGGDGTNGTPRVTSETRPSNIAVYWYVKVR